jgi:hypothetical protein
MVSRACARSTSQLNLPFVAVNRMCRTLLDSRAEAEPAFLNFSLDALVVSIMGTWARDFQLDLCNETVALLDAEMVVRAAPCRQRVCRCVPPVRRATSTPLPCACLRLLLLLQAVYGAPYFMPLVPRLTATESSRLESIVRACNRGTGATVLPQAFARMDKTFLKSAAVERTIGRRCGAALPCSRLVLVSSRRWRVRCIGPRRMRTRNLSSRLASSPRTRLHVTPAPFPPSPSVLRVF